MITNGTSKQEVVKPWKIIYGILALKNVPLWNWEQKNFLLPKLLGWLSRDSKLHHKGTTKETVKDISVFVYLIVSSLLCMIFLWITLLHFQINAAFLFRLFLAEERDYICQKSTMACACKNCLYGKCINT